MVNTRRLSATERAYRAAELIELRGKVPAGPLTDAIDTRLDHLLGKSRTRRLVTWQGRIVPLVQVCAEVGLSINTVYKRLARGTPLEEALTQPRGRAGRPRGVPDQYAAVFPLRGSKVC